MAEHSRTAEHPKSEHQTKSEHSKETKSKQKEEPKQSDVINPTLINAYNLYIEFPSINPTVQNKQLILYPDAPVTTGTPYQTYPAGVMFDIVPITFTTYINIQLIHQPSGQSYVLNLVRDSINPNTLVNVTPSALNYRQQYIANQ